VAAAEATKASPAVAPAEKAAEPSIPEEGMDGPPYKYSKAFMMSFKDKCTEEPEGLEKSECTGHGNHGGPSFGHGYNKGHHHGGPPGSPMHGHRRQGSEGGDQWDRKHRGGKHHGGMSGLQGLMPGSRGKRGGAPGMHGGRGFHGRGNNWQMQHGMGGGGNVKLHKTENKYVVGQTQSSDPEEEKKQKEIISVLNKLTPQNFDKLILKLVEIKFDQEKSLVGLIDQIFDKSLSEPTFCELYAQLCSTLRDQLPEFEKDGKKVNFRRVLLNKCQEEFEKGDTTIKNVREDIEKVEALKFDPEAAAKEEAAAKAAKEAEEAEKKAKAAAAAEASEESSSDQPEKAAEGAAAGADAENADAAAGKDKEAEKKKAAEKTPKTVKEFELWVKRKIRALRDEELKARRRMLGNVIFIGQLYKQQMLTDRIMHQCIVEQLGNIDNPDPESVECLCKLMTTIGSQIDQPKSKKMIDEYFRRLDQLSKNQTLDSRIRFMVQDVIDLRYNSWRLRRKVEGPKLLSEVHKDAMQAMSGGRGGRGGGGGRRDRDRGGDYGGRGGGNYGGRGSPRDGNQLFQDDGFVEYSKRPQSGLSGRAGAMPTRLAPANFLKPNFKNRGDKDGGKSPRGKDKGSKGHGGDRDRPQSGRGGPSSGGGDSGRSSGKPSAQEKQQQQQQQQRESASASKQAAPQEKREAAAAAVPALSEEETRKKAKGIIEEFHNLHDFKEVSECVKEIVEKKAKLGLVLELWVGDLLEGKKRSVEHFRKLVVGLGTEGLFKKEDLHEGMLQVICTLEDLEIDVPKAPAIVAEIFGDLVANKLASMDILGKRLSKAFEEFTGDKVEDLFGETPVYQDFALLLHKSLILRDAANSPGAGKAWTLKEVEQGFSEAGIKLKPFEARKIERHGCGLIFAHVTYTKFIQDALKGGQDIAAIKAWFDKNVAPAWLDSLDNQLIVIFALQLHHHEQGAPKGLMTKLLKDFYYADILTEDAFNKWRDDNKDETPGKVKAISDAALWLNELAAASSESDEEE